MGTGVVIICAILNERRRPIYFGDGSEFSLDLGGNTPKLSPPGQQALPPPGTRQIGHTQRRAQPGPKK
jgi:hypothetical protein